MADHCTARAYGTAAALTRKISRKIHDFSAREVEIHFHTFTRTSALDFLQLVRRQILPDSYVLEAVDARAEILLVLKKGEAAH